MSPKVVLPGDVEVPGNIEVRGYRVTYLCPRFRPEDPYHRKFISLDTGRVVCATCRHAAIKRAWLEVKPEVLDAVLAAWRAHGRE